MDRTSERTNKQTDERTHDWRTTNKRRNELTNDRIHDWWATEERRTNERTNEQTDERIHDWRTTKERTDEQTIERTGTRTAIQSAETWLKREYTKGEDEKITTVWNITFATKLKKNFNTNVINWFPYLHQRHLCVQANTERVYFTNSGINNTKVGETCWWKVRCDSTSL